MWELGNAGGVGLCATVVSLSTSVYELGGHVSVSVDRNGVLECPDV